MKRSVPLQFLPPKATHFMVSLVLVGILGCVMPVSEGGKMQVEVDVFSGRPNPEWTLTPSEVNELNQLVQALPTDTGEGTPKEGLGYRGLIVTKTDSRTEGYNKISISNGHVIVVDQGRSKRFADRNRSLERWVFQTGKGRLEEPLYQQIRKQLD